MFKKNSLLFLFLLSFIFGFSQTKEIDSLKQEILKPSIKDTTKIRLYLLIGEKFYPISNDSLAKYSSMALQLSKSSNNYLLAKAYNNIGLSYLNKLQLDSARYYFNESIKIGEKKRDTSILITAYANYAAAYDDKDFSKSVKLSLKAINLIKNNNFKLAESQFNLGVDYSNADYDSLALKYLNLAVESAEKSNHNLVLSYALQGILEYQITGKNFDKAKLNLDKSLKLCQELTSPRVCYNYYIKAGYYYDELKEFDKAEIAYYEAIENIKKVDNNYDLIITYNHIAEHFILVKKPKKAIEYLKKIENIEGMDNISKLNFFIYKTRAKAEKMDNNFENSTNYYEKYIIINDSLNSEKNKTSIANAETKYQTEKKEKELAEQRLVMADQQLAIQENKSKTRTMSIVIISLLLASILLWFIFQQRQKRIQQQLVTIEREHEVRTLESLMEGEEKERFRIAKELHDGVNGDLSAIKFKLSSLLEMNNTVIKEAVTMIDNSCEQVRAISHNLVPPSLKDFNLIEVIDEYCQSMNNIHKPKIEFQHLGDAIKLDKKQETNLFRIVQELVTNSIKHSDGSTVDVQLSYLENLLQLTVEDNGNGFDPKAIKSDGIGMQNVQSRVDYLNATMDFLSNNKGTSYTIVVDAKTSTT
ncbi:sensor histidine kinase [uncultured Dokdonia sp.]|uniref:tetratricopeptide repeat-containing sensor histidine kinase n=1 Tax=uncultured Dokdonia sp. TaxID=575653 RepID=UPI00263069D8|nr:sensor histidine kinase [uncultured Dokdonia sp.]